MITAVETNAFRSPVKAGEEEEMSVRAVRDAMIDDDIMNMMKCEVLAKRRERDFAKISCVRSRITPQKDLS